METTLDKYGRILIPKAIRQRMGWRVGQRLVIDAEQATVQLLPLSTAPEVTVGITLSGLPVIKNGAATTEPFDTVAFLRQNREAYLDRNLHLK